MARNIQPIVKRCRALGISPAEMGYTAKSKNVTDNRAASGVQRREPRFQMGAVKRMRDLT